MKASVVFAGFAAVLLVTFGRSDSMKLNLHAKLLAKKQVIGEGFSVTAQSFSQCLALCNKNSAFCDGVNFRVIGDKKCRLLKKCANTTVIDNTTGYEYYSKRPKVLEDGFEHEAYSDSCFKVVPELKQYAEADETCHKLNGRLAKLSSPTPNKFATTLLKKSGAQYAWIGLIDYGIEGQPVHSDGTSVLDTKYFKPAPQHWRNATNKNCWALNDDGYWAEFSCKNQKLFSICEIPPY